MDNKFCVDCVQFMPSDNGPLYHKCRRFFNLDMVTGEKVFSYCSIERKTFGRCLPSGVCFETDALEVSNG